jgi:hypothetical protein
MLVVIAAAYLLGCTRQASTPPTLTQPTYLCGEGRPYPACRTAEDVERLLAGDLEIVEAQRTTTGLQRANVMTLRTAGPNPVVFRAKWRAHTTTTATNSPRFELAAYALQKLFLEPSEYVVPPTAPYCFRLSAYREHVDPQARETFPRSGCVYGVLSYWIENVTTVRAANNAGWFHGQHRHLLDPELLERDVAYRNSVARVNLLTYLIRHGDSHNNNFVIARTDTQPPVHTVYSVDNSKSFTLAPNRRIKPEHDWSAIRVPSLPRETIDRLRTADLSSLAMMAVLQPVNGRLVARPFDRSATRTGTDWSDVRLVVGLTEVEIAGLRERVDALLERVDRHELALY